ncbi:MAG: DNA mismatch repair endonuclease MutL [Alistipes sp.]|nr:DNA mismatch repair endonuclease MutL [Candidatus Minthomonas equi]
MPLHVLPQNIANLIAAGEVVQRPASVVKELVENSIDAGAESVSVIIEDSGRTLIQVIDDGCGMSREEAGLCIARHATSKITTASDLDNIATYGFRGEALPSIAAVAEVTLKSRKRGEDTGSETFFAGSEFISQEETACPEGTNIAARNIFYNTPARRKFLKSDAAEFRQIISEFSRVALVRPQISMRLLHNGKTIYDLKGTQLLKKRILDIEGSGKGKELIDVRVESSIVKISGYIGDPKDARKGTGYQYFFVNGRYFRSAYLNKAVLKAYDKLIPDGHTPSYYLYLETEPGGVDINIHPTKTEVRFENESSVFEIIYAAVREALGSNAFTPSIDFDMSGVPEMPSAHSRSDYVRPPKIDYNPLFDPFASSKGQSADSPFPHHSASGDDITSTEFPGITDFNAEKILSPSELAMGREETIPWQEEDAGTVSGYDSVLEDSSSHPDILIAHGKYILTNVKSGILVISISRARERIFCEQFLHSLDNGRPSVQVTLFPVLIDLNQNDYDILMEDSERLTDLGFDIRSFGPSTIIVNGIPDGLSTDEEAVKDTVTEMTSIFIREDVLELRKAVIRHRMAVSLSASAARAGKHAPSVEEARTLIDRLFKCSEPARTPDGRKIMEIMTLESLSKFL